MGFTKFITTQSGCLALVLSLVLVPAVSLAQQYYDPGLLRKTIDHIPADYEAPGMRLGGFVFKPGVELAREQNDNIFYLEAMEISDTITHLRPWANLHSDWSRHQLNINAFADIGRYNDFGNEDYEDWVLILDGRVDVKRGSFFNFKTNFMGLHEDRSSPDDVFGATPTQFSLRDLGAGYAHTFNRLTAMLDFESVDTDYDNNFDGSGTILDNQDRDRTRDALTLSISYERSPQHRIFFGAGTNEVDYDQTFDVDGFQRSSDGYRLQGGISWDMTGLLTGDLYLQYFEQDYDDPAFGSVDGFGIGGSLLWTPTLLTHVNFHFDNAPQETTQAFTSGYNSSLYSARLQHELRHNLLANVRFSYTDNDYEFNGPGSDSLTNTEVIRGEFGLIYLFNRHAYISGGYLYEKQDANAAKFEYKTTRWFLTLALEL